VEKDGVRMYVAPKIKGEGFAKGETVESWGKKELAKFRKNPPDYAKEE